MTTANAGLASLPFSLAGTRSTPSIAILVVGRQANAGTSLGFGKICGRHIGSDLIPPFAGNFKAVR